VRLPKRINYLTGLLRDPTGKLYNFGNRIGQDTRAGSAQFDVSLSWFSSDSCLIHFQTKLRVSIVSAFTV